MTYDREKNEGRQIAIGASRDAGNPTYLYSVGRTPNGGLGSGLGPVHAVDLVFLFDTDTGSGGYTLSEATVGESIKQLIACLGKLSQTKRRILLVRGQAHDSSCDFARLKASCLMVGGQRFVVVARPDLACHASTEYVVNYSSSRASIR